MITIKKEIPQPVKYEEIHVEKLEDWQQIEFESSSGLTEEFAEFARMFKVRMKEEAAMNNLTLIAFNRGHFYVSGFIRNNKTKKFGYFSISDVRYFSNSWLKGILNRTAEHEKDYTGGINHTCDLVNIGYCLSKITA